MPKKQTGPHLVDEGGDGATARLMEDYAANPGEEIGAMVEMWRATSFRLATAQSKLKVRRILAEGAKPDDKKRMEAEMKQIVEAETIPAEDELENMTWQLVDLLQEAESIRLNVANWAAMPRNLRRMLKRGLMERKFDVRDLCDKADVIEDARTARILAGL